MWGSLMAVAESKKVEDQRVGWARDVRAFEHAVASVVPDSL